jgi:hypothetical protein
VEKARLKRLKSFYPCIVIQNFAPELDRTRALAKEDILGATNNAGTQTQQDYLPIPFTFKYVISAVSRRKKEIDAIHEWMISTFDFQRTYGHLMFKKTTTTFDGDLGVVVPFTSRISDVPRSDGRFEYSYFMDLKPSIHIKTAEWKDHITQIDFDLTIRSRDKLVEVIEEFLTN